MAISAYADNIYKLFNTSSNINLSLLKGSILKLKKEYQICKMEAYIQYQMLRYHFLVFISQKIFLMKYMWVQLLFQLLEEKTMGFFKVKFS